MMKSTDFVVARDDLQHCKLIETELPDSAALPDETLLVKVDRFAFTANNITYATLGDEMKYWQLFPAPKDFGNIPVWALARCWRQGTRISPKASACSAISRWRRTW